MKYDFKEKEKIIIDFIKKNPLATYKDIRRHTKLHPERIFGSLKEAYKRARIKPPRTFDFKSKEERRRIVADYIKKHPGVGGHTIVKETKINVSNAFKGIKEAYEFSGVKYPRRIDGRTRKEKKQQIVELVKKNPLITINEIFVRVRTNPYKLFKNMKELYKEAGINFLGGNEKIILKKRIRVIDFIKKNKFATQREINKGCKTHVQDLFEEGIFEAYKLAGVKFPFERLKQYGIGIKAVRESAKRFEEDIAVKLSGYGKVNRIVQTGRGFADIILERRNKKFVIEVKDYKNKDISVSQINQLNKYLEDCRCNMGFLICHNKPKKDKFLIGRNKIFILEKEELKKLPELIDGSVV